MFRLHKHLVKQSVLLTLCMFLFCSILCCVSPASRAETIKWKPYVVVSEPASLAANADRNWKIRIISSDGTVLREIHGTNSANIKLLKLGPQCNPILTLELGDGGNDGLNLVYAYSYSGSTGMKNLVAIYGSLDELKFEDLRHHVLPELIVDDPALNQLDHFSRSALGGVIRVYEWNGDTYQDKTPQYAGVTSANLNRLRSKFVRSLPAAENYVRGPFVAGQDDSMVNSREDAMAATLDYWANAIVAGKTAEADQLFRQKASLRLRTWMKLKRSLLLNALAVGHKNIRTDDSKLVGT